MPLDDPTYFGLLDLTNPRGTDVRTLSDDFQRNMRASCQMQFPNLTAAVTATHGDLNLVTGLAAAGAKLMTGTAGQTVIFVYNATAPVGWTIEIPDANIRDLRIGPSGSGGTIGGTHDPSSVSFTVSITSTGATDSDGAHTHSVTGSTGGVNTGDINVQDGTGPSGVSRQTHIHSISGTAASDGAHTHTITDLAGTGSTDVAHVPRYASGILVKLDA